MTAYIKTDSITAINPIEFPNWDKLISHYPDVNIFNSSCWANVLTSSYNFVPTYLCLFKNDFLLLAIPFFEIKGLFGGISGVSMPFTDFIRPVIPVDFNRDKLIRVIKVFGKKRGWKSFRLNGLGINLETSNSPSFYLEHELELNNDPNKVFSNFKSSNKRNIKKAMKKELMVSIENSYDALVKYYNLHCITRKYHGLPPQPFYFFKNIYKHIISKGKGIVILAEYDNLPISGAVFFNFNNNSIYKYGASIKEYQHLRPNNLVMWKAIEHYCIKRYKLFSFGITEPSNVGLLQFKREWGVRECKVYRYNYNFRNKNFVKPKSLLSGFHNYIFKNLSIPLLKVVGQILYRYVA